ncbi:MAG TPA: dienelactone hydrolase family protein [Anaerolineae bacterium]|nr:dienelactone hydrolase family protein [Anaerolineae bacterium]
MPRPAEIRNGRGVWVLPAWRGLIRPFKEFCDRLAQTGFVALASSGIKPHA